MQLLAEKLLAASGGGVEPSLEFRMLRRLQEVDDVRQLRLQPLKGGEHVVAIVLEDVAPEAAIAAGNTRGIKEPFSRKWQGGAGLHGDQSGGDRMREMADVGEVAVVLFGGQSRGLHAERAPEFIDGVQCIDVGARSRRENAG